MAEPDLDINHNRVLTAVIESEWCRSARTLLPFDLSFPVLKRTKRPLRETVRRISAGGMCEPLGGVKDCATRDELELVF